MRNATLTLLTITLVSTTAAAQRPSDLAAKAWQSDGAYSWIVTTANGWPVLQRPYDIAPLAIYYGWTAPVLQVSAEGHAPKPTVEQQSWTGRTIAYGEAMKVSYSRCSPAAIFDITGGCVTLGRPPLDARRAPQVVHLRQAAQEQATAAFKYVACVVDGKINIQRATDVNFTGNLSEPWLLLWYGDSAPLRGHLSTEGDVNSPTSHGGRSVAPPRSLDIPVLVRLEHQPAAIRYDDETLILQYPEAAGKVAVMPLFGARKFTPEETEVWAAELPADVVVNARMWSGALRDSPIHATEIYNVDGDADMIRVTNSFSFVEFEDDWDSPPTKAAPLPPMLSLAISGGLPVEMSSEPKDMRFFDTPGPLFVVPDSNRVTYVIKGLGKILLAERSFEADVPAAAHEAADKLAQRVREMVAAGHLSPLPYYYAGVAPHLMATVYWSNPAELAHTLHMAWPYLPEDLRTEANAYLAEELTNYPPFENVPFDEGTSRVPYEIPGGTRVWLQRRAKARLAANTFRDLLFVEEATRVLGASPVPAAELKHLAAGEVNKLLHKQDWALAGPGELREVTPTAKFFERQGEAMLNSLLAGAIGLTELSDRHDWPVLRDTGWYLMGKLAVQRIGMANYIHEAYDYGVFRGEAQADWRGVIDIRPTGATLTLGHPNYLVFQDQEAPIYYDPTPQVLRLLGHFGSREAQAHLSHLDRHMPFWYLSEAVKMAGTEHRTLPLEYKNGPVLAQHYTLGKSGQAFRRYVDTTRFLGDLYAIQNLAALVESYCGR